MMSNINQPPQWASALYQQSALQQYQQYLLNQYGGLANGFGSANQAVYSGAINAAYLANLGAYQGFAGASITCDPLPREGIRAGEVTGWRIWLVNPRTALLRSVTANVPWVPGEPMKAERVDDYGAGSNGVHAFSSKAAALALCCGYSHEYAVMGSVSLWGEIVEHEHGYRAEYATVKSLDYIIGDKMAYRVGFWEWLQGHRSMTRESLLVELRARYLPGAIDEKAQ